MKYLLIVACLGFALVGCSQQPTPVQTGTQAAFTQVVDGIRIDKVVTFVPSGKDCFTKKVLYYAKGDHDTGPWSVQHDDGSISTYALSQGVGNTPGQAVDAYLDKSRTIEIGQETAAQVKAEQKQQDTITKEYDGNAIQPQWIPSQQNSTWTDGAGHSYHWDEQAGSWIQDK